MELHPVEFLSRLKQDTVYLFKWYDTRISFKEETYMTPTEAQMYLKNRPEYEYYVKETAPESFQKS